MDLAWLDRHDSTGLAPPAQLYRRCSIGTALQARLYTGVALQAQLYRQAQGNPLKEAGRSQTKSQVRGDYAASGCRCFWRSAPRARLYRHSAGTTRRDTALQAWLQWHGSTGTPALYRRGSTQARLYSGLALYKHGFTGMALYRQGSTGMALKGTTLQARRYRHGHTGTALQARLCRRGSTGRALQARLFRHGCVRLHV